MHRDMQPIKFLLCRPRRVSPDHQCNHQPFFSGVQLFTVVFFWMADHDLCSRGSWDCGQVKDYCAAEGAPHNRQTSSPPQSDKKPGRQTYVHARTHTQTHRERMLEPPGQTDWCHWFSAITESITELQGEKTQHPLWALNTNNSGSCSSKIFFSCFSVDQAGCQNLNICNVVSSFLVTNERKLIRLRVKIHLLYVVLAKSDDHTHTTHAQSLLNQETTLLLCLY